MQNVHRATIRDVAKLAGLSTATVSRVLTGARPVNTEADERVRRAAKQLGYRPNSIAQSLRKQETHTLGLVVADITNPFFPLLVQAVEREAHTRGYGLLLADAQNSPDIESENIALLLDKRVDALLISPSHRFLSRTPIEAAHHDMPIVQLDRVADESLAYVRVDQSSAITQLIDHLWASGRRNFAFIGSDSSVSTSWERQQAFETMVHRVDVAGSSRVLVGDFTIEWGHLAASRIMNLWPEVDAVICANDLIAYGALEEFNTAGWRVPERIGISGFDDTLIAQASRITSVRQPVAEMAHLAVSSAVMAASGSGAPPTSALLLPELAIRASTAPAA